MDQSQGDFAQYLEALVRRKWTFIVSVILGTAIAVTLIFNLSESYRSTTFILVEQQKIPEAYVTPTDSTPFEQRLGTIQQQVMSRTNLEKIITNYSLYKKTKEGKLEDLLGKIRSAIGITETEPIMESIVDRMRDDIEIEVMGEKRRGGGGGEAFRISYIGSTPEISMQITNTLASLFIEENLKIKEQYAEGTSEFLIKELEKAKEDLAGQEVAIRRFKERHMGALPEQLDANLRTLDRLQLQLQSASESLRNAQDRKTMLEEQPLGTSPRGMGANKANPYEELLSLKNELAALLSVYNDNYPDVIIVKNRIKELKERLSIADSEEDPDQKEGGRQVDTDLLARNSESYAALVDVRSQITALKLRGVRISKQIKAHEKRVEDTPANEQALADLTRDYDITLQNYQSLLEKKLNARLAQNLEKRQKGARFRVVDPANLPEKPFKPNKPRILLFGIVGGAGFGVGLVMLLELLNPAFRKPEDFAGVLDQPVLVSIPIFAVNYGNGFKKKPKVRKKERRGV